jgi:hypothetical protein
MSSKPPVVRGLKLEAEPSVDGGLRLEVRGKKFCDGHFCLKPKAKRSSNLKRPKALPPTFIRRPATISNHLTNSLFDYAINSKLRKESNIIFEKTANIINAVF